MQGELISPRPQEHAETSPVKDTTLITAASYPEVRLVLGFLKSAYMFACSMCTQKSLQTLADRTSVYQTGVNGKVDLVGEDNTNTRVAAKKMNYILFSS